MSDDDEDEVPEDSISDQAAAYDDEDEMDETNDLDGEDDDNEDYDGEGDMPLGVQTPIEDLELNQNATPM